jgi:putative ABC transport system substrate-binding protein
VEATSRASLASALEELARRRIDALVVVADGLFIDNRETVFVAAARNRWPVAAEGRDMLEAGALIAYEALMVDQLERMATFIDRILRGARPADLPVEQPTRFRLILNLRAADALGVSVPQALQLRADEVMR